MAINPNLVDVPAQSKKLDTATTTTTAGLVHRQVISLADPETATSYARVSGGSLQVSVQNATLAVTQSGTFNITNISGTVSLPTGASTATLQTTGNTSLNSIDTKTPALSSGRVPVESNLVQGLTDTQLRASPVPISFVRLDSGTDSVTTVPSGTQTVSGTVTANIGTTNGLALDTTVNGLLKPSSTLNAVSSIINTVVVKADSLINQTNAFKVDGSAVTQPISAASLPLPTGAATQAKQDAGNVSLSNIDTKLPNQLSSAIPVSARDYRQDVARGLVATESVVVIKGYNSATSTTNEPVWAQSGATYPQVTSAVTLTISSSSANDTLAGTGAQIVLVKYVRFSDLVEVTALFNMNGQTAVTISADGYAINDVRVTQVGSTNSNVGVIYVGYGTVTAGVPANILATITATAITGQQAVYTVPASKTLELVSYRISPTVLSVIQFRLKPSKSSAMLTTEYDIPLAGVVSFESPYPSLIPAGYQIQMWGRTTAGAGQLGVIIQGDLRG